MLVQPDEKRYRACEQSAVKVEGLEVCEIPQPFRNPAPQSRVIR